jgi:hypothetical protein
MPKKVETVPNQRTITVSKQPTDKQHKYTANNLDALDEAALRLQSKGGFKLYMYLAKNQDKYYFALSSAAFCMWSGLGLRAYTTAFEELKEEGYLVAKEGSEKNYIFYDKSVKESDTEDIKEIEMAAADEIKEVLDNGFKF